MTPKRQQSIRRMQRGDEKAVVSLVCVPDSYTAVAFTTAILLPQTIFKMEPRCSICDSTPSLYLLIASFTAFQSP